jgi:Na+/melibiose symporter-like transporter
MFDIRLFTRPAFGATSLAETVAHFALVGGTFAMTQYLQFVWGQRPLAAGLSMLPMAFGVVIGSAVAARLLSRIGGKYLIAAGMAGISVSLALISRLTVDSPYVAFAVMLAVMSLGMGLAMAPATDLIMGAVDRSRAGVGSATNDATRELGSAMGVAVFGSLLSSGYRAVLATRLADLPGGAGSLPPAAGAAVRDSIGSAMVAAGNLPGGTATAVIGAARQAFVSGMSAAASVAAVVAAVGVVIILVWLPGRAEVPVETRAAAEASPIATPLVGGAAD